MLMCRLVCAIAVRTHQCIENLERERGGRERERDRERERERYQTDTVLEKKTKIFDWLHMFLQEMILLQTLY